MSAAPTTVVTPALPTLNSTSFGTATPEPTIEPRPTPVEGTAVPITVDQIGFTATLAEGNDYTTYAALLSNPNTEWAVYRMLVLINFLDASETFITGADIQVTLLPGQVTAIAGQAFGAGSTAALQVLPPEDLTSYVPFTSSGTIEVSDVLSERGDAGLLTTGTLTSTLTSDQTFLQLFAVYRDAGGDIIGGATGAVESIPSGGTVTFEISDTQAPPTVATTDVYWQLGGQLP